MKKDASAKIIARRQRLILINIQQELEKYGLNEQTYEACLADIGQKINGSCDMDWSEIVAKYNLGIHGDTLRKASQTIFGGAFISQYYKEKEAAAEGSDDYLKALRIEKQEIKKERQRLSDERVDYQRSLREEARRESFLELVEKSLLKTVEPFDYREGAKQPNEESMIVCLSDLHAGIECNNAWNTYNTGILKNRMHKYLDEINAIQKLHKCKICDLVLGGDNISGLIHPNLRLQNNEDVVSQLKIAAMFIGEFANELLSWFEEVRIHSISGNHSRLSPNKEEHLNGEELDALIPFILGIMFKGNSNVKICEDGRVDNSIDSFVTPGGKLFYVVHGDKDHPSSVAQKLTMMIGVKPSGIIMSHRHHNAFDTQYGVKIIQVGCLVGTDDHCVDLRISGEPEQCVIISTKDRAVRCIYDVGLK